MMNIIKHITYYESKHIINEFVKFDILYREQKKKDKIRFYTCANFKRNE